MGVLASEKCDPSQGSIVGASTRQERHGVNDCVYLLRMPSKCWQRERKLCIAYAPDLISVAV